MGRLRRRPDARQRAFCDVAALADDLAGGTDEGEALEPRAPAAGPLLDVGDGSETDRALLHRLSDEAPHLVELRRRRGAIVFADDVIQPTAHCLNTTPKCKGGGFRGRSVMP